MQECTTIGKGGTDGLPAAQLGVRFGGGGQGGMEGKGADISGRKQGEGARAGWI